MWFGLLELLVGIVGISLGMARKTNRSSMVIALGLMAMGVAHLAAGRTRVYVTDAGAVVLLFGLGMTLSGLRRAKKKGS